MEFDKDLREAIKERMRVEIHIGQLVRFIPDPKEPPIKVSLSKILLNRLYSELESLNGRVAFLSKRLVQYDS